MINHALSALFVGRGRRGRATSGTDRRRHRNRLIPGSESLEVRDCPSALGLLPGSEHAAHSLAVVRHETHQGHDAAVDLKKTRAAVSTIYVAPKGKTGRSAGKTAARPLGSLAMAMKRAKPGATIILAPGVYTQALVISGKSNITVVGAANGGSVMASGGQGVKVYASTATIMNLTLRSPGGGNGMTIVSSTVTASNINTVGNSGDGVLIGQGGVLTADSSHFDQVQTGSGVEIQPGGSATFTNSTFNGDGGDASATTSSSGLRVDTGASANVTGSQFNGNAYFGLNAYGTAQVTVSQSTFNNNGTTSGDGAIIQNQATVNLTGNTFASNGVTVGEAAGLNGIEFLVGYTGTAIVSGNSFLNNTANGIYVGGSTANLQIVNNQFQGNVGGIFLDSSQGPVVATVAGNTFSGQPVSPPIFYQGIIAGGGGVTATLGGSGSAANTFTNYSDNDSIYEAQGANGSSPNLTILTNNYTSNGTSIPASEAIHYA